MAGRAIKKVPYDEEKERKGERERRLDSTSDACPGNDIVNDMTI